MKKVIYSIVAVTALFLGACGVAKAAEKRHEGHNHSEISNTKYACPMKCEGEKTYDKKGECPVCNMDLEEVTQ